MSTNPLQQNPYSDLEHTIFERGRRAGHLDCESELAALRRFRDGARAVIEFYAQGAKGDDLEVIPEKQEIWALPEKWAQRSMSDHWSGKRAREFISSEVWKGSE